MVYEERTSTLCPGATPAFLKEYQEQRCARTKNGRMKADHTEILS
jgi:hypothetical protein